MSVSFWCPEAPMKVVRMSGAFEEDGQDYTMEVSTLPELNVSNSNAIELFQDLGLQAELCGTWEVGVLDDIAQRIRKALVKMVAWQPRMDLGDSVIEIDVNRLMNLHKVVVCAKQAGLKVSWG